MANEKDVFEVREAFRLTDIREWSVGPEVRGPDGFGTQVVPEDAETYVRHLNEAFRLGYRAALMEKT